MSLSSPGPGLVPSGETDLELAERTLLDYGIATPGDLIGRASARSIYHEALAAMDGTAMPAYVNQLMDQWLFPDALQAVIEAGRVFRAITDDPSLTAEQRVLALDAFESAASPEALAALEQAVLPAAP